MQIRPYFQALSETFPWLKPLYDGCSENREIWKKMAEQVEMGLTWINSTSLHDAISNLGGRRFPVLKLSPRSRPRVAITPYFWA
jgi:hypothetical protein